MKIEDYSIIEEMHKLFTEGGLDETPMDLYDRVSDEDKRNLYMDAVASVAAIYADINGVELVEGPESLH